MTFSGTQIIYTPTIDEYKLLQEFETSIANLTIEMEALIYIAAYVAHRFRHKYPELGFPTKTLPLTDNWLSCISTGNCIYPSKDLQTAASIMNEEFIKFHGCLFSKESGIFDKLTSITCAKVSFPACIIACLVRTRTYIRLRQINQKIKQQNCTRKAKKKFKHMCNKQSV